MEAVQIPFAKKLSDHDTEKMINTLYYITNCLRDSKKTLNRIKNERCDLVILNTQQNVDSENGNKQT